MPIWLHPGFLAGFAAVLPLVAIYFLYNRLRKRSVSAIFLWRILGQQAQGQGRIRPLLPPLLFWVELLLIGLLVLAAAGLCWRTPGIPTSLVVILDDSISMQATAEGVSSRQRALSVLQHVIKAEGVFSLRVIRAGLTPQLGPKMPADKLSESLPEWTCWSATADLTKALVLARTHAGKARILVLTDHPTPETIQDPRIKWVSVGRAIPNAGICNAVRTAGDSGQDSGLIEVACFGDKAQVQELKIEQGTKVLFRQKIELQNGEVKPIKFQVPSGGILKVSLLNDGLEADNRTDLPPAWRPQLRVHVSDPGSGLGPALVKVLKGFDQGITLTADAPDLIFSGAEAEIPSTGVWLVRYHRPSQEAPLNTGPFIMNQAHALCDGVDLDGVVWCGQPVPPGGIPLIMAGETTLLSETDLGANKRVFDWSLDPRRSTLIQNPNWPILIWNFIHLRSQALPGFNLTHGLCGQWVPLRIARLGEGVKIHPPVGEPFALKGTLGGLEVGFMPEIPGLYRAEMASGSFALAVQSGVPEEADLTGCAEQIQGRWEERILAQEQGYWSLVPILGLLILGGLALHAWLVWRKGQKGFPASLTEPTDRMPL